MTDSTPLEFFTDKGPLAAAPAHDDLVMVWDRSAGVWKAGVYATLFPLEFQCSIAAHSNVAFAADATGRALGVVISGLQAGEVLSTISADLRLGRDLLADDAVYYDIELFKVAAAGSATGTSIMISGNPDTTETTASGGLWDGNNLPSEAHALSVEPTTELVNGDHVYAIISVNSGSPAGLHQRMMHLTLTGTRQAA